MAKLGIIFHITVKQNMEKIITFTDLSFTAGGVASDISRPAGGTCRGWQRSLPPLLPRERMEAPRIGTANPESPLPKL